MGLFADGTVSLLAMVIDQSFTVGFDDPRGHFAMLTQSPVMLAMVLGVTDLRWLARLYSLALFALPTALYTLALLRARNDAVALAATIAAITLVFMTTSFFIVGEFSTAYAAAILTAVWLATASRLRVPDGIVLVAIAAFVMRCYEHYLYLGPLLALMTLWAIVRAPSWPAAATALYGIAAILFLTSTAIAAQSLIENAAVGAEKAYMATTLAETWQFRFNIQLDLLLMAAAIMVVWGTVRPHDLERPWPFLTPYWIAGLFVLLVALSPLLIVAQAFVAPPYSTSQQTSRTAVAPLAVAAVLFIWLQASRRCAGLLPLFSVLRKPQAARRLVLFASAMLVATVPWNAMLTVLYSRYLEVVRATIRDHGGLIDAEASLLGLHPRLVHDTWALSNLSLIMRAAPGDGIIVVSREANRGSSFDPASPPDLARLRWRD